MGHFPGLRQIALLPTVATLALCASCADAPSHRISTATEAHTMCNPAGRYLRRGYAQTRDAIIWMTHNAPNMKFGLSIDEVWSGIECGYDSVRLQLRDAERLAQIEESRRLLREAVSLFKTGSRIQAVQTAQSAEELFISLRRVGGRKLSRQELADTEHSANEVNEP